LTLVQIRERLGEKNFFSFRKKNSIFHSIYRSRVIGRCRSHFSPFGLNLPTLRLNIYRSRVIGRCRSHFSPFGLNLPTLRLNISRKRKYFDLHLSTNVRGGCYKKIFMKLSQKVLISLIFGTKLKKKLGGRHIMPFTGHLFLLATC
jgi:hypothetical protein